MFKAISLQFMPIIYLAIAVAARFAITLWKGPVPPPVLEARTKVRDHLRPSLMFAGGLIISFKFLFIVYMQRETWCVIALCFVLKTSH